MSDLSAELNLALCVDNDDTADYLTQTSGLRGSLNILDGLFNSGTGHNHNGAHQGGALNFTNLTIAGNLTVNGSIDSKGAILGESTLHILGASTLADVTATTGHFTGALTLDAGITAPTLTTSSNLTVGQDLTVNRNETVLGSTTITNNALATNLIVRNGGYLLGTLSSDANNHPPMIACTGDNMTGVLCGPGGTIQFINSANTVRMASFDNSGDLSVNGWIKPGNNSYIQWNDTNHRIQAGSQNVMQFYETGGFWQYIVASTGNAALNVTGNGTTSCILTYPSGGGVQLWNDGLVSLHSRVIVGGGTDSHGYTFYVGGTAGGLASWNSLSTERVKDNITPISAEVAWGVINDSTLHGIHYTRNDRGGISEYGFSAERWHAAVPEAVHCDGQGPQAMDYSMVIPFLFNALKDVSARLAVLEAA